MSLSDLTGGYAQSLTLRGDLQARLLDFLARKDFSISERLEALLHLAESTLSRERLKTSLKSLVARFRRNRNEASLIAADNGWDRLVERIHEAGREGTIENYSVYLFTVDQKF